MTIQAIQKACWKCWVSVDVSLDGWPLPAVCTLWLLLLLLLQDSAPVRRQRAKLADLIDHYAGKLWDVTRSLQAALSATAARALSAVKIFRRALCGVRDITELFRNLCEHFTGKDRTVTTTTEPAVRTLLGLEANSSSTPLTQTHMDRYALAMILTLASLILLKQVGCVETCSICLLRAWVTHQISFVCTATQLSFML